jgi:hypothetical protein
MARATRATRLGRTAMRPMRRLCGLHVIATTVLLTVVCTVARCDGLVSSRVCSGERDPAWCPDRGDDNCRSVSNAEQLDMDGDGVGDASLVCCGGVVHSVAREYHLCRVVGCWAVANANQDDSDRDSAIVVVRMPKNFGA